MDAHAPYDPPPEYRRRFAPGAAGPVLRAINSPAEGVPAEAVASAVALYDACNRYVDDRLGEIVAALERSGELDRTLLLVTSDHGDEFLDHGGLGHGTTVYGELVRVPLVVRHPELFPAGGRVSHLTRHLDVAPTLVALAGLPRPESFRGHELTRPAEQAFVDEGPWRGVYALGHKLILDVRTGEERLFAIDDALDRTPVEDDELRAELRARLDDYLAVEEARGTASGPQPAAPEWSEEELEHLRSLGYAD